VVALAMRLLREFTKLKWGLQDVPGMALSHSVVNEPFGWTIMPRNHHSNRVLTGSVAVDSASSNVAIRFQWAGAMVTVKLRCWKGSSLPCTASRRDRNWPW